MNKKELPATVQFHKNIDRIKELRQQHYPMKLIWETLNEEGNYSRPYSHFTKLMNKYLPKQTQNGGEQAKENQKETTDVKVTKNTKSKTPGEPALYTKTSLDQHS